MRPPVVVPCFPTPQTYDTFVFVVFTLEVPSVERLAKASQEQSREFAIASDVVPMRKSARRGRSQLAKKGSATPG